VKWNKLNNMIRRRIFSFSLLFLLTFYICAFVSADWTTSWVTGNWLGITRTSWSSSLGYDGDSWANFTLAVDNFTGYHAQINFTSFSMSRHNWYDVISEKYMTWAFVVNGSASSNVVVYVRFREATANWGWITDRQIKVSMRANDTRYDQDEDCETHYFGFYIPFIEQNYVDVYIWRDGDNLDVTVNYIDTDGIVKMGNGTFVLNSAFFENTVLWLRYKHSGYGEFSGGMSDTLYSNDAYSPSVPLGRSNEGLGFIGQFLRDVGNIVGNVLPKWMNDFLSQVASWGGWLYPAIGSLVAILPMFLPMLPLLLFFYLLDVTFTSVSRGSFEPIGDIFIKLYGLAAHIVSAIVGIASAVWSFIKFW